MSSYVASLLTPWRNDVLSGWQRQGAEEAPTVHFLHGTGFCSSTLLPVAEQLPQDWNLLFTDLPGHAESLQPDLAKMPDWRAMAKTVGDALEQRMQAQGSGPVIGVGHSMGGIITLLLAAERPHLFSRIVLLDPIFFSPAVVMAQKLIRHSGYWRRTALVKNVAARQRQWPDLPSMKASLQTKALYKRWQEPALDAFLEGGTRKVANGVELSCNPKWEAAIFGSYPKGLWRAVKKVAIPVEILVAERSYGFIKVSARKAVSINANIHWQPVTGSHCFPMENPEYTAQIIRNLTA